MSDPLVPVGDGHTELPEEDREGLIPTYVATRGDLFDAEQRNIAHALLRSTPTPGQLLEDFYLRRLHQAMFKDVWRWAGHYRRRETNIGIDPTAISIAVRALVDDARTWVDCETYEPDELAVRFHHRLVQIHAFPNGNGRHGRIAADYLVAGLGRQPFGWGAGLEVDTGALRSAYRHALQDADGNVNASPDTFAPYVSSGTPSEPDVLTSTDPLGNETQNAYNTENQVWCSVDAAYTHDSTVCPSISPPTSIPTTPYPGTTINVYNSPGDQLIATIDTLGNTTTYAYTSGVSGVPNGLMYCSVDPVDYKNGVRCPAYGAAHTTGTTTSTFNSADVPTTTTDADGDTTAYSYTATNNPGLASSETSPDGTLTSFTYNADGNLTLKAVSFGSYLATIQYAYNASSLIYCEVAPYEYALGKRCPTLPITTPTPASDLYPGVTITTYDGDGRVVQLTNPLGGIAYTAYDSASEVYCTVAPYESQASIGVTCPSLPITTPIPGSDSYEGATITTYDSEGRVIQLTNSLGGITLTAYDPAGNIDTTTVESGSSNAPNVVTTDSYDADNRVDESTVGSGSTTATTRQYYDPNGNVYCSLSANAYALGSAAHHCPPWQAAWIVAPPSTASLYSTTPTLSQANNVTTAFFNADGDEVQTTNPDVETSISDFNGDGRVYCTSDPVNVATWLTANPSGTYPYLCPATPPTSPPVLNSDPGYVTTIYDSAGRTLSVTDALGDTTGYTYDPAGNTASVTDPRGEVTTDCYYWQDTTGACAASAPSAGGSGDDLYSQTTPATTSDPSGETTTSTYYAGDLAHATTTPAGTTTDAYDALGDLTSEVYSGAASGYTAPPNVGDTYYGDGSLDTTTDGTGTTTSDYDAMGDLTSQALVAGSGTGLSSKTTSYTYFSTGQPASVVYPSYGSYSDPAATYTYDSLGNLASVTDWLGNTVTFTHDGDGNLTSQDNAVSTSYPSGTSSTSFSYDLADENTGASSSIAQSCSGSPETLVQSFSGTTGSRNADGQVTSDSQAYTGSCSSPPSYGRFYSYDQAGRVVYQGTSTQGSSPNDFSYNPAGELTEISSHVAGIFDSSTQSFDAAGETLSQTPIAGSGGASSTYTYDTLGDQRTAVSGSSTASYSWLQPARKDDRLHHEHLECHRL